MAEEWGLNCSYSDMNDWTLSKYGEIKKSFINTAAGIHGVKAKVPFAVVLPRDYICVELPDPFKTQRVTDRRGEYMACKLSAADTDSAKEILFLSLTEEDVIKGTIPTPRIISKPTGGEDNPAYEPDGYTPKRRP